MNVPVEDIGYGGHGYPGISLHEYLPIPALSQDIFGYPGISPSILGSPKISRDILRYPRITHIHIFPRLLGCFGGII